MNQFDIIATDRSPASLCRRALLLGRASAFAFGLMALPALPGLHGTPLGSGVAAASDSTGVLLVPDDSPSSNDIAESGTGGTDDPAGHDATDDNGVDPVGHDAADDNGTDPAGHDAGDDNGGSSGNSGSGSSGAASSNSGSSNSGSGSSNSGSDGGEHGGSGSNSGSSGEHGGSGGSGGEHGGSSGHN
jgi:hypothetical protein